MKKLFEVIIGNHIYGVWNIPNKIHSQSAPEGLNTWWVYYGNLETDVPDPNDSQWVQYSSSLNRLLWDIRFEQLNTSKEKFNDVVFSNVTVCNMSVNGSLIYSFTCFGGDEGLSYGMAKAQSLKVQITEHAFNFLDPQSENGRKIYYKGLPATIKNNLADTWEIGIVPDYTRLEKAEWWKLYIERSTKIGLSEFDEDWQLEKMDIEEYKSSDYINLGDALYDHDILWSRHH